ncbi:hypothetical protein BGZ65_009560 [Modicella reniformis]|uniref:Uncharacterized protein n=1 Tax=Modicella reniformis TaxID=1440133 RepID=A0A9P6SPB7_9FUNG|nr:hypothetical protein BGZ65_009560 [Modicella reniformis]
MFAVYNGSDNYRAWIFTLASAMACVFGAGLIFIDTIATKFVGREVRMLQNHKFLAGSLGLGSGVMIFSSFYNLLPEAKEALSSELSIFNSYADAALMVFFFAGVGAMTLIHWIMHQFYSGAHSPGIESNEAIEQFMQREASQPVLPQHHVKSQLYRHPTSTHLPMQDAICNGCAPDKSDDEEDHYSDSEYVGDEVTSLLNSSFLQIGKTPNSSMDDGENMQRHHGDVESIEVVISDQKDKLLRRAMDRTSNDVGVDLDSDFGQANYTDQRKNSWSSASTCSQKPFTPANKKRKSDNVHEAERPRHNSNCPLATTKDKHTVSKTNGNLQSSHHQPNDGKINSLSTYGSIPPSNDHRYDPQPPSFPHSEFATLRHTSFPRLKSSGTIYSRHDDLDHAVADTREHADLTEVGIQTALTIAIHKFPGNEWGSKKQETMTTLEFVQKGLITFLSTTADPCLGLSVFIAITVHNLIEGYLIAFPLFIGLQSRGRAFALAAALGGLSQPLGALLGWLILRKVTSMGWQLSATGCIYAMVAGMMTSIAVNGMWPQAVKCVGRNPTKVVQYCFFAGIAIMGICQAVMGTKCDI